MESYNPTTVQATAINVKLAPHANPFLCVCCAHYCLCACVRCHDGTRQTPFVCIVYGCLCVLICACVCVCVSMGMCTMRVDKNLSPKQSNRRGGPLKEVEDEAVGLAISRLLPASGADTTSWTWISSRRSPPTPASFGSISVPSLTPEVSAAASFSSWPWTRRLHPHPT